MTNPAYFGLEGDRLQIALRDIDGYPIGVQSDGDIVAADDAALGETYHAVTVSGYVSHTAPTKSVEYATDISDGTNKGKVPMGISDYGTGEIVLSEEDEVAQNMVRNAHSDTTLNTAWTVQAGNETAITSPAMVMMFTDRTRNQKTGQFRYRNKIYHNATITITTPSGASQSGGTNPNPTTWSYDVAPADRISVMGYLFSDSTLDVEEDNDTYTIIWSDNPLSFTTYIGDGSSDPFTLLYKPLYSTATGASRNTITKNGALLAVTSVNTTTGVVTPAAALTSGHIVIVLYETRYKLVA